MTGLRVVCSDNVFALAYLLGFYFAPRIPNFAERRLYTFGAPSAWPVFEPFIAGRIDEKLITAHWNDVLRFVTSIRTEAASASLLLKRLGAYPRQNSLALTLREIERIERTLFMLDWLELPGLRRQATAELNKGEARNALARAVCFHRLGRLRDRAAEVQHYRASGLALVTDRAAEVQHYRASGLALVTAAIVLWNTVYLGRALDELRRGGHRSVYELKAAIDAFIQAHKNDPKPFIWTKTTDAILQTLARYCSDTLATHAPTC